MTCSPNCIEVHNAKLTNKQQFAYTFNTHFSIIAKNLLAQNQPSQSSSTTSLTHFNNHNTFFINCISAQKIKRMISTTKPKSSLGCDDIPSILLRELSKPTVEFLAHIFNQFFNTGKFSCIFKLVKGVTVFKKKNSTDLNNCRLISLFHTFSKILDKEMHKKMLLLLNRNHIISQPQSL